MATNPDDIRLGSAEKRLIAKLADERGKAWSEVLREALDKYAADGKEVHAWMKAQEEVFARAWENDADAVYDAL